MACGVLLAVHGAGPTLTFGADPVGGASFHLAPLAAPFIALLGLVAGAIALYSPRYHEPGQGTAVYLLVYNLALLASLAVLIAGNVVAFLVAWETMALLCYLVILRHHTRAGVAEGAFLFIALSEVGFPMIVLAFAILATQTGSLDLATIAARAGRVTRGWRAAAFLLGPARLWLQGRPGPLPHLAPRSTPGRARRRIGVPLRAGHQAGGLRHRPVRLRRCCPAAPAGGGW